MQLNDKTNLFDFFHGQVQEAVSERGVEVSEEGVFYLSKLLVDQGHVGQGAAPETLVELHMQAQHGSRAEAIRAYGQLGDRALFTSGFFRGSIDRRAVSVDYYMDMGAAAYDRVANLLRLTSRSVRTQNIGGHKPIEDIFDELANTFAECSEVLLEVRDGLRAQTDVDDDSALLRLYEEWLHTGSHKAAERLRALGVVPMRPGSSGSGGGVC